MWKKYIFIFLAVGLILWGIMILNNNSKVSINNNENNDDIENIVNNETDMLSEYITDECVNEWGDYSLTVQEEIKEASENLSDENKTYIVKAEEDYIKVYYLNSKNEEILYKVTDIAVQYLGNDDVEKLKQGIQVIGIQELNQLLEDFE